MLRDDDNTPQGGWLKNDAGVTWKKSELMLFDNEM